MAFFCLLLFLDKDMSKTGVKLKVYIAEMTQLYCKFCDRDLSLTHSDKSEKKSWCRSREILINNPVSILSF